MKRSKVKVTIHENVVAVALCTLVSAARCAGFCLLVSTYTPTPGLN